ncbi:MAG: hypothetical protein KDC99_07170 [Cyclobacteriaceae bacterium]|nr:hypothetical protein [Cyclobacteriaceae bacterium]
MTTIKYIFSILLFVGLLGVTGCRKKSDDPGPTALDLRLEELMNDGTNWVLGSDGVTKDGLDVTDQFAGFKLTIGNKTYSTVNGLSPVWEPTGTWDFQSDNPDLIVRDGSTQVTVNLSTSALTLIFTAAGVPGGRVKSVSGEYQFHLVSE